MRDAEAFSILEKHEASMVELMLVMIARERAMIYEGGNA